MNTLIANDSDFTGSDFAFVLFGYIAFEFYRGLSGVRSEHSKPAHAKWPIGVLTNGMNFKKISSDWIRKQEAA